MITNKKIIFISLFSIRFLFGNDLSSPEINQASIDSIEVEKNEEKIEASLSVSIERQEDSNDVDNVIKDEVKAREIADEKEEGISLPIDLQNEKLSVNEENQLLEKNESEEISKSLETPKTKEEIEKKVIIDKLKGLLLVGSANLMEQDAGSIEGVCYKGLDVPGAKEDLNAKLIPIFMGKDLTYELIEDLKQTIINYYKSKNHPFVTVLVLEQEVSSHVLQMVVIEGKIEAITVKNNRYVPTDKILASIHARPGEHIDEDQLLTDIAWINRNPFQNANIIFSEGNREMMTDIDVVIQDRFPLRVYTGADNSGSEFTGLNRWIIGLNWGNLFSENHIFSYQFNSSFDFHKFMSHTLSYTAHLFFHQTLSFFGGYAIAKPDLVGFNSTGRSFQGSFRYDVPIGKLYTFFQQGFVVGADYKDTNNNIATVDTASSVTVSDYAALFQMLFNYYFSLESNKYKLYFSGDFFVSPFKFLKNQTETNYNAFHAGAKPQYFYIRLLLDQKIRIPWDFRVHWKMLGQAAYRNLLPSEQIDLGGQTTVRGYDNRVVIRDNAFLTNLELQTFDIHLMKHLNPHVNDRLKFLGFIDFAAAKDHTATPGIKDNQILCGVGAGLRYYVGNNLSFDFDWGYPLKKMSDNHSSKLYFQGLISF